jgi:acyl CoA:acetate/3-ketoacid CoA transferase alpha subunit
MDQLSQNGATTMRNDGKPTGPSRNLTLYGTGSPASGSRTSAARFAMRPDVAFLTQLLAVRHGSPEYRERRRAEPATAIAAYRAATVPVATSHAGSLAV